MADFAMFEKLPHRLGRLRLRTLRPDDLEIFHQYRSDPAVARYQGWEPMSCAAATDYLASHCDQSTHVPGTWRQLAIADLATDTLVGDMGIWLSSDCQRAEVGLSIAPIAQGKGYGSESLRGLVELLFASTSVLEIEASTDTRNGSCLAALRRAGFNQLGTRQAEYKGEICTESVFLVRRDDSQRFVQVGAVS